MSDIHPSVRALWEAHCAEYGMGSDELPPSFYFCDNEADANVCAQLVREGTKRATAASLAELELDSMPIPQKGDFAIVTNWAGEAVAIIQTTSVDLRPFKDVDEAFAAEEGEGDKSLQWWREAHEAYYRRVLAGSDTPFNHDLMIACERFEVVRLA
ncbi:MAG: ASCH domain-containing protein [Parvularculaceae bacterium]|nr:ASCH domain-containing protein [Parvularculaceae bacterium]